MIHNHSDDYESDHNFDENSKSSSISLDSDDNISDQLDTSSNVKRSRWSVKKMFKSLKHKFQEKAVGKRDKFYFQSADMFKNFDDDLDDDLFNEYNSSQLSINANKMEYETDDDEIRIFRQGSLESMGDTFNQSFSSGNRKEKFIRKVKKFVSRQQTWIFLFILGTCSALLSSSTEQISEWIINFKLKAGNLTRFYIFNYFFWIALSIILSILSALITHHVGPYSAGSGIPAMKSILSGIKLKHYLSFRTLVAKVIGLTFAYTSGLVVGREGPFVHICAALANQLARIPLFTRIRRNDGLRFKMIAAGCAAGVAATFGAPMGGVIFAIEVTSTYFLVSDFGKAFFCAISTTLFLKFLTGNNGIIPISIPKYELIPYKNYELLIFSAMGLIYGLISVVFIKYVKIIQYLRRNFKIFNESRYGQVIFITLLTALVSYPIEPLRQGPSMMLDDLFSSKHLNGWDKPNLYFILSIICVLYFIFCGVSLGLPLACGLYAPVFVLGATSGRLVGELLRLSSSSITAGAYAAVGAAAYSAGVTRTLSSAIIVFELTGQMTFLIPVILSVLIASAVGNFFGPSLYDELLQLKGLPYMPPFKSHKNKTARSIMRKDLVYITADATYEDLKKILYDYNFSTFPLVDSKSSRLLLGTLPRSSVELILENYERTRSENEELDLSLSANLSRETPGLDQCPFQVVPNTPLSKVHFMFSTLGLSVSYIVDHGVLVGVITKKDLMRHGKKL